MKIRQIFLILVIFTAFWPVFSHAKTDLAIDVTDITFSKDNPLAGEEIRVFARVFNLGDTDVYGFVIFTDKGKEMAPPQPISVKSNTYDDVFINWEVTSGTHDVQAKILETNLTDDNPDNNTALKENYFVDIDTDGDGIGDLTDQDDDGDGLSDETEKIMGTDPLLADTDGDKIKDGVDIFPLDASEWQDTDQDGIGDNADLDDDNDGLSDEEEIFTLGANPLSPDTDQDGLSDAEEISLGTSLVNPDTDKDGVSDFKDQFPLDPSKAQASILESLASFIKSKNIPSVYIFWGAVGFFLVLFLFFKIKG